MRAEKFVMDVLSRHLRSSLFQTVFMALAFSGSTLLVAYAFLASADSVTRAQIVVRGLEQLVAVLSGLVVFRAAYLLGNRRGALADEAENAEADVCIGERRMSF